jgi:MATE family multidrug resistance protein
LKVLYNVILNLLIAGAIFTFRYELARVFTVDETLIPLVTQGYFVMIFVLILHGLAMVEAGAVRGLGMLTLASWIVLFSFYCVALPCAYAFSFPFALGMLGLWWGVAAGGIAEIILYFVILTYICDWKHITRHVSSQLRIRLYSSEDNISMHSALDAQTKTT